MDGVVSTGRGVGEVESVWPRRKEKEGKRKRIPGGGSSKRGEKRIKFRDDLPVKESFYKRVGELTMYEIFVLQRYIFTSIKE